MISSIADLEGILRNMRIGVGARSGVFADLPYLEFDDHIQKICADEGLDEQHVRCEILREAYRLAIPETENEQERLVRFRLWSRMIRDKALQRGVVNRRGMPKGTKAELQRCFDEIIKPTWPDSIAVFETKGSRQFGIRVVSFPMQGFILDYQIYGSLGISGGLILFTLTVFTSDGVFLKQMNLNNLYLDYHGSRPVNLGDVEKIIAKYALMIDYTNRHFRSVTS